MPPKKRSSPDFVNSRYVLLTYAQSGSLDAHRVMDHISGLAGQCIIGREHHADGGLHLHVFCDFGRKFRSRRVDVFDVDDRHPNVSRSYGTPEKGYDYAIKDGDVVCGELTRPLRPSRGNLDGETDSVWTRITEATTRDEFWELVHFYDPRAAACSFSQLNGYANWKFDPRPAVYESPPNLQSIGEDLDGRSMWLSQSGIGSDDVRGRRMKSLVLYGPTRTGKTSWARSLGNHIYVIGLVSGKVCSTAADVEYAVFDDIRGGIKFFHAYKEWLGCQPHVTVKELYREPKLVEWGKPSIWLANNDPRDEVTRGEIDWLNENCIFVEVREPIVRFN